MGELATISRGNIISVRDASFWTDSRIALVKQQIMPGAKDEELQLFLTTCQQSGLNPFTVPRKIWAVPFRRKVPGTKDQYEEVWNAVVAIDGLREAAAAAGQIASMRGPIWYDEKSNAREVWLGPGHPSAALVEITTPEGGTFTGVAYWDSFARQQANNPDGWGFKVAWQGRERSLEFKNPGSAAAQLGKCAEALALRRIPKVAIPGGVEIAFDDGEANENADAPIDAEFTEQPPTPPAAPPQQQQRSREDEERLKLMDSVAAVARELGQEPYREVMAGRKLSQCATADLMSILTELRLRLNAPKPPDPGNGGGQEPPKAPESDQGSPGADSPPEDPPPASAEGGVAAAAPPPSAPGAQPPLPEDPFDDIPPPAQDPEGDPFQDRGEYPPALCRQPIPSDMPGCHTLMDKLFAALKIGNPFQQAAWMRDKGYPAKPIGAHCRNDLCSLIQLAQEELARRWRESEAA